MTILILQWYIDCDLLTRSYCSFVASLHNIKGIIHSDYCSLFLFGEDDIVFERSVKPAILTGVCRFLKDTLTAACLLPDWKTKCNIKSQNTYKQI